MTTADQEFLAFWLPVLLIDFCLIGPIGGSISRGRGKKFADGYWLAAILGLVGLLIVAVRRDSPAEGAPGGSQMRECPHCKQFMRADAAVCVRCQRESRPWVWHNNKWWWSDDPADGDWFVLDSVTRQWTKYEAPVESSYGEGVTTDVNRPR